jgi:hypothetical protein
VNAEAMRAVLSQISFQDWAFVVDERRAVLYLQVQFTVPDPSADGVVTQLRGRNWLLSEFMTPSEVVLTAFKAVLTALEHEARESFTYRGRPILGPHFDVEALVELADAQRLDVRQEVAG